MYNIKQIIIVRSDLNMRRGKESAQSCHSSGKIFSDRMLGYRNTSEAPRTIEGRIHYPHTIYLTEEMEEWQFNQSFAKIVCSVDSLEELLALEIQAKDAHIPCALITDNGNTEFKNICPDCMGKGECLDKSIGEMNECKKCEGTGKISKPTITCLAIGPDLSERIDPITGGLKLR